MIFCICIYLYFKQISGIAYVALQLRRHLIERCKQAWEYSRIGFYDRVIFVNYIKMDISIIGINCYFYRISNII